MARKTVVTGGSGIGIDTRELRELAVSMRTASSVAKRNFRAGMYEIGDLVVEQAKANVSDYPSVAKTVARRVSGATIEIRAGEDGHPLGRLLETGNLRRGRVQPTATPGQTFRHPVWAKGDRADWRWAKKGQPTHPFLEPAAAAKMVEGTRMLISVFDDALRSRGIKAG